MDSKFTWKAEIEFNGTPEQFNALTDALDKLNITIVPPALSRMPHLSGLPPWPRWPGLPPWPWPHLPGLLPISIAEQVGAKYAEARLKDARPAIQLRFLKDIRGGIRDAHLHLGEEIIFLDRAAFKAYVGEVAQALAQQRVDLGGDYIETMAGLEALAAIPIQIP
jgi:hypothetical protein